MPRRLSRRYGANAAPALVIMMLIIFAYIKSLYKNGSQLYIPGYGFFVAFFIIELIPLYFIYYVLSYKICVDDSRVFVTPLAARGPLMVMRFHEVETVDLKPNSEVVNTPNAGGNPSKIVLYRKGWDGYELFALDPLRTNLKQFKDLVRLIHDRCPGTFTENALRYINSPKLMTPRENRQGELAW